MALDNSSPSDWKESLAALPDSDFALRQPPGYYQWRARRGAPIVPLKLIYDGYLWHLLFNGEVANGSGQIDPLNIPFVKKHGPFGTITEAVYDEYRAEFDRALPGSPLRNPTEPVDLRAARPLGRGH